ncbi:MAG: alpha/beta fold hydrolase [Deltaproteobacteria bacterium]|nr:alpha/beta fold hydrolase [Deltaproteobacteria bacterium]
MGHLWTVRPLVDQRMRPASPSPSLPVHITLTDPRRGAVPLSARLHLGRGKGGTLVVLVHGLGGSVSSHYVVQASAALSAAQIPHIRLNLRGADRTGFDFYHAGQIDDLAALCASPELADYDEIVLWGTSLGGHVSLRFAALTPPSRLRAVVAVCPPLDLLRGSHALDRWHRRPYLRHVLRGLKEIYAEVAARSDDVPLKFVEAAKIQSIRAWDERIVAPWHGFDSADHYYGDVAVGPLLPSLKVQTLVVTGQDDPMIPVELVRPMLSRASSAVEARIVRGGHVGFARDLSLGQPGPRGIDQQIISWIKKHSSLRPQREATV